MKNIISTNVRNEFDKDVYQDAYIVGKTLAGATATKVTGLTTTAQCIYNGLKTDLAIYFNTLVGNFPDSGIILLGTEYIKYSSVYWNGTTTAGILCGLIRGAANPTTGALTTAAIYTAGDAITLVAGIVEREEIVFWNTTGSDMWLSTTKDMSNTKNSVVLPAMGYYAVKGSPLVDWYAYSVGGGVINVVEYR
jgi:hypothetical protein